MKTEWKQIAEITVNPLRYVALKTDSDTFRMQILNGASLMSDRMYRGKHARDAMRDCLSGFPVWFSARLDNGCWKYGLLERLSLTRQAQVDTIKGIDSVIRGFIGKRSAVEEDALNGLTNICMELRELWKVND